VTPEDQSGMTETLVDMVTGEVLGRLNRGAQYGPEVLKSAVATVASQAAKLGIQTTQPNNLNPGLGIAGTGLDTLIQSDEPIERVSSRDPNYADNVLARLGQKVRMNQRISLGK